jgi:phosphohistidine phosphatase SixA
MANRSGQASVAARSLELYLLRHADAGDPQAWDGDDDLRPLSEKGVRQAERLGRHLASIGFEPDALLSSPKVRALRTAEIVAAALGVEPKSDERLGGGVVLGVVERILGELGDVRRPVLVGHDPDFSELVATLSGARAIPMKKGALARVDLVRGLEAGGGVLRWLVPPDLLPRSE